MKKINLVNKLFKTTTLIAFALGALTIISCEVGMGAAVDTAIPTIEISYPPKNAIIRDTFIAAGICSDDLGVTSVSVTLQNTSTKKVYGRFKSFRTRRSWVSSLAQLMNPA